MWDNSLVENIQDMQLQRETLNRRAPDGCDSFQENEALERCGHLIKLVENQSEGEFSEILVFGEVRKISNTAQLRSWILESGLEFFQILHLKNEPNGE